MLKKIFLLTFIIILLFVVWRYFGSKQGIESHKIIDNNGSSQEEKYEEIREYVRLSIFAGKSYRASLAIPEDWEGKYRKREEGDSVGFYFIGDPKKEILIFEIKYFDQARWQETYAKADNKYQKLLEKNEHVLAYWLSTSKPGDDNLIVEYDLIAKDREDIIQSIK